MGVCRLCGQKAGWLSDLHPECRDRQARARKETPDRVAGAIASGSVDVGFARSLRVYAKHCFLGDAELSDLITVGWVRALDLMLMDTQLTPDERAKLDASATALGVDLVAADRRHGVGLRLNRASLVQQVLAGAIPTANPSVRFPPMPFVFDRDEYPLDMMAGVPYLTEVKRRVLSGASQGYSVRIARGVYYRVGQSRGISETVESVEQVDARTLVIASKHLYFGGDRKTFRIPYKKIISVQPFTDGIGVVKEAATPKMQIFGIVDGITPWFYPNMVMGLVGNSRQAKPLP